jgi:hypothetical protein
MWEDIVLSFHGTVAMNSKHLAQKHRENINCFFTAEDAEVAENGVLPDV